MEQPSKRSRYWHCIHRCKYCKRRFVGGQGWRFFSHLRSHERAIKPYWYKKTISTVTDKHRSTEISTDLQFGSAEMSSNDRVRNKRLESSRGKCLTADELHPTTIKSSKRKGIQHAHTNQRSKVSSAHTRSGKSKRNSKDNSNGRSDRARIESKCKTDKQKAYRFCNKNCQLTGATKIASKKQEEERKRKRYHCQFCSRCFSQNGGLVIHERIHLGEKPFLCTICDVAFYDKSNLRKHHRTHTGEKIYCCKYCNKKSADPTNHKRHEAAHEDVRYKCTICDREFTTPQSRREHERIHTGERPYACRYCNKTFTRQEGVIRHERIHTGDKRFKCSFEGCQAAFIRSYTLTLHKRTHTGEKPYKCNFCNMRFSNGSGKKAHEKQHIAHITSDPGILKRFKCSFCERVYTNNYGRREHERMHTGEMPYHCQYCNRPYVTRKGMKRHEETHTRKTQNQNAIEGCAGTLLRFCNEVMHSSKSKPVAQTKDCDIVWKNATTEMTTNKATLKSPPQNALITNISSTTGMISTTKIAPVIKTQSTAVMRPTVKPLVATQKITNMAPINGTQLPTTQAILSKTRPLQTAKIGIPTKRLHPTTKMSPAANNDTEMTTRKATLFMKSPPTTKYAIIPNIPSATGMVSPTTKVASDAKIQTSRVVTQTVKPLVAAPKIMAPINGTQLPTTLSTCILPKTRTLQTAKIDMPTTRFEPTTTTTTEMTWASNNDREMTPRRATLFMKSPPTTKYAMIPNIPSATGMVPPTTKIAPDAKIQSTAVMTPTVKPLVATPKITNITQLPTTLATCILPKAETLQTSWMNIPTTRIGSTRKMTSAVNLKPITIVPPIIVQSMVPLTTNVLKDEISCNFKQIYNKDDSVFHFITKKW